MPGEIIFDNESNLTSGARGEPGQRLFYVIIEQGDRWARIWLEKGELVGLGQAVAQSLAARSSAVEEQHIAHSDPPGTPIYEFQASQIGLGADDNRDMLILMFRGEHLDNYIEIQAWASKPMMHALSARIDEVAAAGRPTCPLCGLAVDPAGHFCVRTNGRMH